jgi:hypothetical protein
MASIPQISQLIAAINPDLYYDYGGDKSKLEKFKESIKELGPYNAVKKELDKDAKVSDKSLEEHKIVYDSSAETLEPIYFFILDLLNDMGLAPEKLVDNFTSTPGGTHFSEIGMKATRMQEETSKVMGTINAVLRSVLNLLYDLRDFETRLAQYTSLRSKDENEREAARLSLKQIWLDKVDIAKGNSSIKAMALGQGGFQTLLDAFLVSKDEKDASKLDLNERVKRIVEARIYEFNKWIGDSEGELRKRFEIEKIYLKSQVSSLKLYSRWVKPYLVAASNLEMKQPGRDAGLVNMFNTVRMELTLLGKKEVKPLDAINSGDLPIELKKVNFKRKYYSCILVDFVFRAVPRQGGLFSGRTEVTFKAYSLNEDELKKFNKELDKSEIADVFRLIEGSTTESLDKISEEIARYTE